MTQSHSDMDSVYEAINGLWKVCKTHLENPPHTVEDWQRIHDDFCAYCGGNPFRVELATSCYRELMRIDGQAVTAERGWING